MYIYTLIATIRIKFNYHLFSLIKLAQYTIKIFLESKLISYIYDHDIQVNMYIFTQINIGRCYVMLL